MNTSFLPANSRYFSSSYFLLLLLVLLIASCSKKSNELGLERKNFDQEISQEQNLVFTFDKALVTEKQLQKWDTLPYIKFTPAIKGRFKWTAVNELVFSPLHPFAPSTDFQADLTQQLLAHTEEKYKIPEGQSIRFHTPYLNLAEARAYWAQAEELGQLEARVNLTFNYQINPAELSKRIHFFAGATELPVEVLASNQTEEIGIRIKGTEHLKEEANPVRLRIDPGLTTSGTSYQTRKQIEQNVQIPSRQTLQIAEITTAVENNQEIVFVTTTLPVSGEKLKDYVSVQPKVNFVVEPQEGGFVLRGNIPQGNNYTLKVSKYLKAVGGIMLGQDYSQVFSFASLRPGVAFENKKSIYLGSNGSRNIALNLVQVPRVKVSIAKVFENNILRYLQDGKMWDGHYDQESEEYFDNANYVVDETNGKIIFEREYDTKSLRRQGNAYLLNLDLNDLDFDSEFKGLYVLSVKSTEKNWLSDSKVISVSDIGLMVKQGKDEVLVFANSIREATTMAGVEIRFISTNNQVVHKATTDSDGVARFPDMGKMAPGFKLGLITARSGHDFTYLPYRETLVNTSRFEVGGKRLAELNYDAFIYGDRELYRPGDIMHVNTVVRTPDWETVSGLPLKWKLLLPNGKEFKSVKAKLNTQGAAETSFTLPTAAVTGTYTLEVYSGNDVLLNSKKMGVEEFMPDRLKVTTSLNKPAYMAGEKVEAQLVAQNFFGPPAAGRNYELQLSLKKKRFEAERYPDYNFDVVTAGSVDIQTSVRQGQTNESGEGREVFELSDYEDIGVLDGSLFTTVFDETGRPVNRLSKFVVNTQSTFYGIREFVRYVSTKQPLRMQLLALDATGKPQPSATAQVQLVRYTYESVIERGGGAYNYKSQRRENIIQTKTIQVPAAGAVYSFTPLRSGSYEVRVTRPGAQNYVAQEFYAYGYGDTESTSFEVNNEGEVDIALDKESYEVGEEAKVLLKSPFAGKILVTVEQNKVLSHFYVQTDKKAASVTIPIKDEHLPTIYITATALRAVKDNSLPLTIARGFKPVAVTKQSTKLAVAIAAPEVSRSQRVQQVKVKTAPNAEVTVAVVDEGILQLKDSKTPDPHSFFYQKRALEVQAYDLYPFLFPELGNGKSSFGGDGFDLAKRVNPLTTKRVKLVSVWSGILKADGSGEATVNVNIPEFSGALRIMAVAYKNNAFGSAEKTMRVSDPVVISTALPRFLSPRDTVLVPVTLTNTTGKGASASSTISVTGPLRLVGEDTKPVSVNAHAEAQVLFKLVASSAIGAASVTVKVKALGEQFSSKTDLSVRPAAPLQQITGAGSLKDGAVAQINPKHDFIPASVSSRLLVSNSPLAQFTDDITYLLQYPHGCLEQTTSTAFPLLYFADLARSLNQDKKSRSYNPNYLIQEAIAKIESMQQYDGGFSYWPGSAHGSDWFTSAYATHFLLEARKAGQPVNKEMQDKALAYLQKLVKGKAQEEYCYYDAQQNLQTKYIAPREIAYSLYVLSLAGKPDWATMNYFKAKPDLLSLDSRYLLASTFAVNGRRENFTQTLPRSFAGETAVRTLSGSFSSPLRNMAMALNALLEADPDHQQVATLARHVSQELATTKWYNTQERAFALLALGKLSRRSGGNPTAQIVQNGKSIGNYSGKDLLFTDKLTAGETSIRSSGSGTLYYFWETEGISQSGRYKEEDNYLQVRKTFFDRNGRQITNNTFAQNDLVIVHLTLQSLDSRNIPNVAMTDLLPAGFEIENPRLMGEREFKWLQQQEPATPDHLDIRDDRINIYATARAKPQHFFYQVRAVNKGNFQMGPVGADAMYNAEYHSYSGAGTVRVR
ncbi:alpha-2-macroglobulin [Pontibacter sp. 13R65]|uniref:alpha-2-macroglobulin family protein n=1 Tax=Pontibacter sp. 13R65 TaxID=3127458 RepID=UPI00301E5036